MLIGGRIATTHKSENPVHEHERRTVHVPHKDTGRTVKVTRKNALRVRTGTKQDGTANLALRRTKARTDGDTGTKARTSERGTKARASVGVQGVGAGSCARVPARARTGGEQKERGSVRQAHSGDIIGVRRIHPDEARALLEHGQTSFVLRCRRTNLCDHLLQVIDAAFQWCCGCQGHDRSLAAGTRGLNVFTCDHTTDQGSTTHFARWATWWPNHALVP